MINRISEIPLWGPEEQIRKFIHRVDDNVEMLDSSFAKIKDAILEEI